MCRRDISCCLHTHDAHAHAHAHALALALANAHAHTRTHTHTHTHRLPTWNNNRAITLHGQDSIPVGAYEHTVPFQNVSSSLHHLHVAEVGVKPDQHCLDIWITLPLQPVLQTSLQRVRLGRGGKGGGEGEGRGRRKGVEGRGGERWEGRRGGRGEGREGGEEGRRERER